MAAAATSLPTFSKDTMHEDRFTELPEEVAHNVISLLPTSDFFALYRSSKKCQELCLTTPFLTFNFLSLFGSNKEGLPCANKLVDYFERFLAHRGERKTQYFHLSWLYCYRHFTLLHYAIRNGVEVLDLQFFLHYNKRQCIFLPLSLYSCGSLRSINLDFSFTPVACWEFPPLIPFPNLQFFSSKSMRVKDGSSFGEWISSWPNIKEIRLQRVCVVGSVNIKSSCLEHFEVVSSEIHNLSISGERVEYIMVIWKSLTSKDVSLKISAPNLKELYLSGFLPDSIVLEKFMHLERFSMFLGPSKNKRCISSNLLGVVSSTPQISLCDFTAEVLYKHDPPIPTLDAQSLHLYDSDLCSPAVVHLLKRMHNLTALYIHATKTLYTWDSESHGFDMNYWEHQDLKFVHQLEHAEIEILDGWNELELAKYLAKHAKQMKEMIIYHRYPLSSRGNEDVRKLEKNSNARIVFLNYIKM